MAVRAEQPSFPFKEMLSVNRFTWSWIFDDFCSVLRLLHFHTNLGFRQLKWRPPFSSAIFETSGVGNCGTLAVLLLHHSWEALQRPDLQRLLPFAAPQGRFPYSVQELEKAHSIFLEALRKADCLATCKYK